MGGRHDEFSGGGGAFLDEHPIYLCGWCHLDGEINDAAQLEGALAEARTRSVSWRWAWRLTG